MPEATQATTNRRSFLTAMSAASVIPATAIIAGGPVALAAPTDPIFAVIDHHRATFNESCRLSMEAYDGALANEGRQMSAAAKAALDAANDEEQDACDTLISTQPTTLSGVVAAITWLADYDEGCVPDTSGRFLRLLARSPLLIRT